MNSTMRNPEKLQGAMKRIMKRLQEKFQRGEFKPQELAAEAEEMMKEFTDNPAFVELMESFRTVFGFQDEESSRAAGRDGENRRAQAVKQIRAAREKRQKERAAADAQRQGVQAAASVPEASVDDVMRQFGLDTPDAKKGGKGGKGRK